MGRVYKALVRAEQWRDADSPIGRPEHNLAENGRGRDARPALSLDPYSAAAAPFVFEDHAVSEDFTATASGKSSAPASSAEVPGAAGLRALVPRHPALKIARHPVLESPAPCAPAIAFEEPRDVSSIRNLAIDPHVGALTDDDPIALERYRVLAVKLMNLADLRKLKTLLITSAEAGEGKTTVATGTAWSLAKHPERRVLLIDAKPTSSSVGRMLGIDPQRGWLNLLDGSCELKNALVRLDPNGLYVLTPGATRGSRPGEALSARLEDLIAELAPLFDLVIVDSGPILESSEAQRLATVLDGAVIVARANHTRHSKVTAARKLVPKERRLGVVLNESEVGVETARGRVEGSRLLGLLFGRKR